MKTNRCCFSSMKKPKRILVIFAYVRPLSTHITLSKLNRFSFEYINPEYIYPEYINPTLIHTHTLSRYQKFVQASNLALNAVRCSRIDGNCCFFLYFFLFLCVLLILFACFYAFLFIRLYVLCVCYEYARLPVNVANRALSSSSPACGLDINFWQHWMAASCSTWLKRAAHTHTTTHSHLSGNRHRQAAIQLNQQTDRQKARK